MTSKFVILKSVGGHLVVDSECDGNVGHARNKALASSGMLHGQKTYVARIVETVSTGQFGGVDKGYLK